MVVEACEWVEGKSIMTLWHFSQSWIIFYGYIRERVLLSSRIKSYTSKFQPGTVEKIHHQIACDTYVNTICEHMRIRSFAVFFGCQGENK